MFFTCSMADFLLLPGSLIAQIGFDHLRVVQDIPGGAFGNLVVEVDHHDTV